MKTRRRLYAPISSLLIIVLTLTACDIPFMGTANQSDKDSSKEMASIANIPPKEKEPEVIQPEPEDKPEVIDPEEKKPNVNEVDPFDKSNVAQATEEDYMKFLNGEEKAYMMGLYPAYLDPKSPHSYDEFINAINNTLLDSFDYDAMQVAEVDYAFIDCGNDGNPELALMVLSRQYENYDELTEYFIIKKYEDGLKMIDTFHTYYRTEGDLNKYGIFHEYASYSYTTWYESYVAITAEGEHEFIFDVYCEDGLTEPIIYAYDLPNDADLPDDYPEPTDEYGGIFSCDYGFDEYTKEISEDEKLMNEYLKGHVFTFYDENDEVVYPKEEYQKIYDDIGIMVTYWDVVSLLIDARLYLLGIEQDEIPTLYGEDEAYADWKVWWDDKEAQL